VARTASGNTWPHLDYDALRPTIETLQLWTQVVGKIRLARTPWLNHAWHATFYVSARGLTTSLIPHDALGFELEFDLVSHVLLIHVSDGGQDQIPLTAGSIADFYVKVLEALTKLGVPVEIDVHPNELPDPTPFPEDVAIRQYDGESAHRFWLALVQCDRVFKRFRTRFIGKCSPVHLFWGSFDLAVTRFSGRSAPLHPGGVPHLPDSVTREAYSHEVSSAGFWPGGGTVTQAAFYSYCYPAPADFARAPVLPSEAKFDPHVGEFILPYDVVRAAEDPDAALLAFLQSTYEAAASTQQWDRMTLEIEEGQLSRPRFVG
jgi:Family of unknown function (DUF5996)